MHIIYLLYTCMHIILVKGAYIVIEFFGTVVDNTGYQFETSYFIGHFEVQKKNYT